MSNSPDDVPALRAAVLVPVLLGVQRQLPEERAGVPDPVRARRREGSRGVLITLTAAVFIGPFFFLSGLGGQMADRFDKSIVARHVKLVEIAVAALGVVGFWLHSIPIMFVDAVPVRRDRDAVRPDQVRHPAGSSEAGGAARRQCAGRRRDLHGDPARHHRRRPRRQGRQSPGHVRRADHGVRALVLGRRACSSRAPARARRISMSIRNIARSTGSLLKDLWSDSRLWWGGLVTSWFWLVGAVVLSLMPPLVKTVLGATEEVVTAFLAVFSISIAIGSGLAAWLAHGRIVLLPTVARRRPARPCSRSISASATYGRGSRGAGRRRAGVHLVEGHPRRDRPRRASRSRAACSSCRRSRPCSPGPAPTSAPAWSRPSTCSTRPSSSAARWWSPRCRPSASRCRSCSC